ncbi:MAG: C4-dicarboxylate TRAP transporter substrate-binding protein [Hyphomicrobiales bacterium]|nr:C4-dicarboxylate TRAP transporter substrate-binding protein [Hyphomicrobiales bacterium]
MHMARILTGTVAAVVAIGFTASAFAANPRVAWNHSVWGKQRAFTAGIEKLAEIVSAKTGGKFTIKVHYGGALSKAKENLDGIKLGAFQSAMFCNFYHPGKNPAFMVFSLPFLPLTNWRQSVAVRDSVYQHPALVADMDNWNAMTYLSTYLPQYEFMGKGKPPLQLADWKGLRVRAGGGIGDAMEKLGAVKTTMPATEVYTAIQRGTADAVSFPYTYAHAAYKIHEVAEWYTGNLSPGTSDCPIVFSKTAFDKLPANYKKILDDAKDEVRAAQIDAYETIDKKNLPMFKSRLQEIDYSDETLAEFRKVAGKPVWDEWVAKNKDKFDAQGVLDAVFKAAEAAK